MTGNFPVFVPLIDSGLANPRAGRNKAALCMPVLFNRERA